MTEFYVVYGYEIITKYNLPDMKLHPTYDDFSTLKKELQSTVDAPATAIIETNNIDRKSLWHLEMILSFIDGRTVKICGPLDVKGINDAVSQCKGERLEYDRPAGGGKIILSDSFSSSSRPTFIELAVNSLSDETSLTHSEFGQLFHKAVLCFAGGCSVYIDVQFYLLFSGLEALARKSTNNFVSSQTGKAISDFISGHGFDFEQQRDDDLYRGSLTYTSLRNACFHNGVLEAAYKPTAQVLKLTHYKAQFERLVGLLILKQIGFDDGHINWNSWLDRMPFK